MYLYMTVFVHIFFFIEVHYFVLTLSHEGETKGDIAAISLASDVLVVIFHFSFF